MIDNFGLVLTHGLLALVAWRLLFRDDLNDDDAEPSNRRGWRLLRPRGDSDA